MTNRAPSASPREFVRTIRIRRAAALLGIALLGMASVSGCRRADDLGPPPIAYGQAECEFCKMIISEEPFAAAAVITTADDVYKYAFDDIGCLLDFLNEPGRTGRIRSYVHDQATLAWLDASHAVYIRSESLHTPMASHVAACSSADAAETLAQRYPGTTLRFEQLQAEAAQRLVSANRTSERTAP